MNYTQAREYIENAYRKGSIYGLDAITALMDSLGRPERKLKIVHIAGTNGKGSVGAFLEMVLREAGYKTGRYVSPTVYCYEERFQINGNNISENDYAQVVTKVARAVDTTPYEPTGFELETAVALLWFYTQHCDVVLVECGLGGANDATNVIENNLLTVLTSISLDHTGILGNTIEEIAQEKCGVIKNNTAVVCGEQKAGAERIIRQFCKERNVSIEFVENALIKNKKIGDLKQCFDFENFKDIKTSMVGAYQFENAALALKCVSKLRCLGFDLPDESVYNGMEQARWGARFDVVCNTPVVVLDGAHNPDGAKSLAESLRLWFNNKKLIFIIGAFADKNYDEILRLTAPMANKIFAITAPTPRGLDKSKLAKVAKKYNNNVEEAELFEALDFSMEHKEYVTVVFGSLSFLGASNNYIRRKTNG